MKIHAETGLFPVGEMEGAPALILDVEQVDSREDLWMEIERTRPRGVRVVWLRHVPWGNDDFDRAVHHAIASASETLVFTSIRSMASHVWSMLDVFWIGDATAGVARYQQDPTALGDMIVGSDIRPQIQELVIRGMPLEVMSDRLFELISEFGAPVVLYTEHERKALACSLRASGSFVIRPLTERIKVMT